MAPAHSGGGLPGPSRSTTSSPAGPQVIPTFTAPAATTPPAAHGRRSLPAASRESPVACRTEQREIPASHGRRRPAPRAVAGTIEASGPSFPVTGGGAERAP